MERTNEGGGMEKDIEKIGNLGGAFTQSRAVYHPEGLSPTLIAGMDHGNTMPYVIEVLKKEEEGWKKLNV